MFFHRCVRRFSALGTLMAAVWLPAQAAESADKFPSRPVTIQIGYSPGGSTDVPFRVLAENASKILGQPVIIENKTGAGGIMPAQNMQSANADGYTLAQIPLPVFRLPHTTKIDWNPIEDLSYVICLAGYSFGLVVPADSPIKDMQAYLDYAKQKPGELTYGTPGVMTTLHLTMESLAANAGVELSHVPYKGNAESLQAVLGNHVMSVADTPAWGPYVAEGKLRLLSTWGDKRSQQYPDVPTLKELGLGIVQTSPFGLAVPDGTDPAIVKKLHDAFKQAMEMPNYSESLAKFDMQTYYMSTEDYTAWAKQTLEGERAIIERLGLAKK